MVLNKQQKKKKLDNKPKVDTITNLENKSHLNQYYLIKISSQKPKQIHTNQKLAVQRKLKTHLKGQEKQ